MASRIKGITVEIGGDTTGLDKALKSVNSSIKTTQSSLKDVSKLLKLDPTNTELLTQKQKLLKDAIGSTKEKLDALKLAQEQAKAQLERGDLGQDKYDALQREIIETEQELKRLQEQAIESNAALARIEDVGDKLQSAGDKISGVGQKLLPVTAAVTGLDFGIVGRVGRAEQHSVALDMQLDAALQRDKAAQIAALAQRYAAAAMACAIVDGRLNGRRIHRRAVAHSAVGSNVAIQHEKASLE